MRISSAGNLLLGVTSDTGLSAGGDFALKNGAAIRFRNAADSAYLNILNFNASSDLLIGGGGTPSNITFAIAGIGEVGRFNSSGNLLVGTTTSPSNSGNISALGAIKGGAVYQSSGFENGNYTLTTPATVYSFNKDQGAAGGSSTTTFNITGVSNTDGAFLFIYLRCSNTAGGINCGANIQVHGTQLFSAAVQNATKTITFGAFRQNGSWVATASATGSQISVFP
jgi:hypothetical protein